MKNIWRGESFPIENYLQWERVRICIALQFILVVFSGLILNASCYDCWCWLRSTREKWAYNGASITSVVVTRTQMFLVVHNTLVQICWYLSASAFSIVLRSVSASTGMINWYMFATNSIRCETSETVASTHVIKL